MDPRILNTLTGITSALHVLTVNTNKFLNKFHKEELPLRDTEIEVLACGTRFTGKVVFYDGESIHLSYQGKTFIFKTNNIVIVIDNEV
jgi:hypothetical protein